MTNLFSILNYSSLKENKSTFPTDGILQENCINWNSEHVDKKQCIKEIQNFGLSFMVNHLC